MFEITINFQSRTEIFYKEKMLLIISTTYQPATDLGYLLHKNPFKLQEFSLAYGSAHVFYPETSKERCSAALLLDINPIDLVRSRRGPSGDGGQFDQYVNDRPYVASSFLSVALGDIYRSAMAGRSKVIFPRIYVQREKSDTVNLEEPMTKKRNEYTKAYRLGAVKLVTEQGYTYAEAGRSLGINANLISRWHRELKALDQDAFPGQGHLAPDQEEIRR